MTVTIEHTPSLDLLDTSAPSLSSTSDIPLVEMKPDSQPAPKEEVKPEAKTDAAPDEGKKPAESAPVEQPEESSATDEGEGKPKPKGVQKRLDELTRNWRDAEAREARLMALLEQKKPQEPKVESEQETEPQKPLRETFGTTDEYASALADYADLKASWSAKQAVSAALAEQEKKAEQRTMEEQRIASQQAYAARVEKASEKYSDYKAVAESPDVTVSMAMAQAILHSENGPELAYHLGKNPLEAKRISSLNPVLQLVELGRIEAKLTQPEVKEEKPDTKPAVSSAPKPIKPLATTGSASAKKSPDEESMEEYAARRQKEIAAERRPGVRH